MISCGEKFGLISMLLYGNTLWVKGEIGRNLFLQRLIDNCEKILQSNRITMIIVKNFRINLTTTKHRTTKEKLFSGWVVKRKPLSPIIMLTRASLIITKRGITREMPCIAPGRHNEAVAAYQTN